MPQGKTVHFVTWPDGKVDQDSINIFSQGHAKCWMVQTFFPQDVFGKNRWLMPDSYILGEIWRGMAEKGFKVHSIDVPVVKDPV
jgi:hypothetical protein